MSQVTLFFGVAPAIAPMVGGFLFVHADWHSIFWFLTAVAAAPELRPKWIEYGYETAPLGPEAFDAFIRADAKVQQDLVKAAGIKAE